MLKQAFNIDQAVICSAIDSHLVGLYPIAVTPNLADEFDLESIRVDLDAPEDMHIHFRPCHISAIGAKPIEPALGEEVYLIELAYSCRLTTVNVLALMDMNLFAQELESSKASSI